MSVEYHYVNFTKREYFYVAALGGPNRLQAVGTTLAARAFELMLLQGRGRWAGDHVEIVSDASRGFDEILSSYRNIQANAVMTVFDQDGFERLAEAAKSDEHLLWIMCHLVETRQALTLHEPLKATFGADYMRQYKLARKAARHTTFLPVDLVPVE